MTGYRYRLGVGIIICNSSGQLLWAERAHQANTWQFPQGGLEDNEKHEEALYRELYEEVGLRQHSVDIISQTSRQYSYDFPVEFRRKTKDVVCIGQTQQWYLLYLKSSDTLINVNACDAPEFSAWQWVSYWYPANKVVEFKRALYRDVLDDLVDDYVSFFNKQHG